MKLLLLCLLLGMSLFSTTNSYQYLLSDFDLTNQEFNNVDDLYKFVKTFPNNQLSKSDVQLVSIAGTRYVINPLAVFLKMEQENNLLVNSQGSKNYEKRYFRACAYGLSLSSISDTNYGYIHTNVTGQVKYYRFGTYKVQVDRCAYLLRKYFDLYSPQSTSILKSVKPYIQVSYDNAASYTLAVYCPFYGRAPSDVNYDTWNNDGNILIFDIWAKIQKHKGTIK